MSAAEIKEWLQEAIDLALKAGAMIKEASKNKKNIETKENLADLVTETDKAVEAFLFKSLMEKYPTHKFVGEETASETGSRVGTLSDDPTWIIDPVDGTTNFVHGFPFHCVSIGMTLNKLCTIGVVYNPCLDHLFYASKGNGAYMLCNPGGATTDRMKLEGGSVPLPLSLSQALVNTEYGSSKDPRILELKLQIVKSLITPPVSARGIRSIGTAALHMCLVAQGVTDIYYEAGTHAWDVCAGAVIVEESGGVCRNWRSDAAFDVLERTVVCVRGQPGKLDPSPAILKEISPLLVDIGYERD